MINFLVNHKQDSVLLGDYRRELVPVEAAGHHDILLGLPDHLVVLSVLHLPDEDDADELDVLALVVDYLILGVVLHPDVVVDQIRDTGREVLDQHTV